jgi:hypothetical protein
VAGKRAIPWLIALAAIGCGGKVVFSPTGGYGSGGGASYGDGAAGPNGSSGSSKPDLHPACEKFCNAYQHCAPVTDCLNGCLVSAVYNCENEYLADVVCITGALDNCTVAADKCVAEGDAYLACQMTSSSSSSTGG